jgi:hypothetical protein
MAGEPINPYAPPASDVDAAPPVPVGQDAFERPLFSPKQIGWATFFGSLFAGIFMLQLNFRAMRQRDDANKALGLGLLVAAAVLALVMFLPRGITTGVNLGVAWGVFKLTDHLQGKAFSVHRAAGGARRSNWLVFGIIMAAVVTVMVAIAAVTVVAGVEVKD